MKKILLLIISLIIGVVLFIWTSKMVGWHDIKEAFLVFTGWKGLVIFLLTVLMAVVAIWKWKIILQGINVKISFKNLITPYLAGFAIMFLAPILLWGGEVFRSYILRRRNSIAWSKGMASVVIDRILEWTANLTVIFFGTLFFLFSIGLPSKNLIIIFGGAFLVFFLGILFFYIRCIKKETIIGFFLRKNQPFQTEKEIFSFFKFNNPAMWNGFFFSFLRAALMWFRAWLLVIFLGKSLGIFPALSILGFNYLAVMIPIPTALGSHEAIQTFAFGSLGIGSSAATAFTMIIRAAELILSLFGIIMLFRLGVIILKDIIFERLETLASKDEI